MGNCISNARSDKEESGGETKYQEEEVQKHDSESTTGEGEERSLSE